MVGEGRSLPGFEELAYWFVPETHFRYSVMGFTPFLPGPPTAVVDYAGHEGDGGTPDAESWLAADTPYTAMLKDGSVLGALTLPLHHGKAFIADPAVIERLYVETKPMPRRPDGHVWRKFPNVSLPGKALDTAFVCPVPDVDDRAAWYLSILPVYLRARHAGWDIPLLVNDRQAKFVREITELTGLTIPIEPRPDESVTPVQRLVFGSPGVRFDRRTGRPVWVDADALSSARTTLRAGLVGDSAQGGPASSNDACASSGSQARDGVFDLHRMRQAVARVRRSSAFDVAWHTAWQLLFATDGAVVRVHAEDARERAFLLATCHVLGLRGVSSAAPAARDGTQATPKPDRTA